jgi:phosphoglycerate dehydrogenase-like enzyme
MNILVAVYSAGPAWTLPRAYVDDLRRIFPQHAFTDAWDGETLRRLLPDADIAFSAAIDRDAFSALPRLRWVQSPAAGVGGMLGPELAASPVLLTSARGVRARAIAEHVLGVTIALARQLPLVIRKQAAHEWALNEIETSGRVITLAGRRMAIVGLGSIGLEVARVAAPFGMRVSAIRKRVSLPRPPSVEEVLPPESLLDLLGRSDVVVLSAPLTADTQHLIGARALDRVKRGALLVNVGRGKLIDDHAVVAALEDGRLGGAALDVFTKEPLDRGSPYWDLPNVIVTPHVAGSMEDYWTPLVGLFAENLRRFEAGKPLLNVVDKSAGY